MYLPVCVRKCAWRLFSLGKTRLQYVHLMLLGDVLPCIMRLVRASARGRPRRWLSEPPECCVVPLQLFPACPLSRYSGEEHELPGLRLMFLASSPQFQGYNIVSHIGGLRGIIESDKGRDSRFGVWSSMLSAKYPRNNKKNPHEQCFFHQFHSVSMLIYYYDNNPLAQHVFHSLYPNFRPSTRSIFFRSLSLSRSHSFLSLFFSNACAPSRKKHITIKFYALNKNHV